MRCYSHLSDDEREQIGLAKALGHSIGAIARAIRPSEIDDPRELSRNKLAERTLLAASRCRSYQLRRRREALIERIAPYEPSSSTASRRGGPRSKSSGG